MAKGVKVLVVYDSATGNTEKMAMAVVEGARKVRAARVMAKTAGKTAISDLLDADAIIAGSPTYYGQMSAPLKALFDMSVKIHGKLEGKVGAAFTSAGGTATGAETTLFSILAAMLVHGMIVQGRAEDKHYGAACLGAPDHEAIDACKELGRRVAALSVKLKS